MVGGGKIRLVGDGRFKKPGFLNNTFAILYFEQAGIVFSEFLFPCWRLMSDRHAAVLKSKIQMGHLQQITLVSKN